MQQGRPGAPSQPHSTPQPGKSRSSPEGEAGFFPRQHPTSGNQCLTGQRGQGQLREPQQSPKLTPGQRNLVQPQLGQDPAREQGREQDGVTFCLSKQNEGTHGRIQVKSIKVAITEQIKKPYKVFFFPCVCGGFFFVVVYLTAEQVLELADLDRTYSNRS